MKIYQPVKPFKINQLFGANRACVSTDGKKHFITCNGLKPPKGYKSVYGANGHKGLDLATYRGQEVYCALKGVVHKVDTSRRSGLDVRIISVDEEGNQIRHIYEHLQGTQPDVGDEVQTGQLVGWADNTGWSSGDHLHFQLEEKRGSRWYPIDPMSRMIPEFAKKELSREHKLKYLLEQLSIALDSLADLLRKRSQ